MQNYECFGVFAPWPLVPTDVLLAGIRNSFMQNYECPRFLPSDVLLMGIRKSFMQNYECPTISCLMKNAAPDFLLPGIRKPHLCRIMSILGFQPPCRLIPTDVLLPGIRKPHLCRIMSILGFQLPAHIHPQMSYCQGLESLIYAEL